MKQQILKIFFFSVALILLSGCTKEINLTHSDNQVKTIKNDDFNFSKTLTKAEYDYIQTVIPNTTIKNAEKTPINGLYKVYTANNYLYVYPFKKLLFFGEIWTNTGKNLTKTDDNKTPVKNKLTASYFNELINKSLVSNNKEGKYKFIVFKSPTCPNCFVLDEYLKSKDIKVHNLYSPNRISAYVLKNEYKISAPQKVLNEHLRLSKQIKPNAVPYIIIVDNNNNLVETIKGANLLALNKYLPNGVKGINQKEFKDLYNNAMPRASKYIKKLMENK